MGAHGDARRALLRSAGRPMVLRRQSGTSGITVTVTGFARSYNPGELAGGVQQGDVRIETLADEITAAAWPAPPRPPDRITLDGRTFTVLGAAPLMEGAVCIGYSIWCRGS